MDLSERGSYYGMPSMNLLGWCVSRRSVFATGMIASLQLKNHRCQGKLQGELFFIHSPKLTEPTHPNVREDATW